MRLVVWPKEKTQKCLTTLIVDRNVYPTNDFANIFFFVSVHCFLYICQTLKQVNNFFQSM